MCVDIDDRRGLTANFDEFTSGLTERESRRLECEYTECASSDLLKETSATLLPYHSGASSMGRELTLQVPTPGVNSYCYRTASF
jgi:hypothetical protein